MTATYNDPADDADRFAYESAHDCPAFRRRCEQTDARIRNDIQALLITAEDLFREWAQDGLLDRSSKEYKWSEESRSVERRTVLRTPDQAVQHWASCIREVLLDARSLTAIEAEEVARGEP